MFRHPLPTSTFSCPDICSSEEQEAPLPPPDLRSTPLCISAGLVIGDSGLQISILVIVGAATARASGLGHVVGIVDGMVEVTNTEVGDGAEAVTGVLAGPEICCWACF